MPNAFQSFFEISNFVEVTGLLFSVAGSVAMVLISIFPSAGKGAVYKFDPVLGSLPSSV
jgi:hypothetical protein